MALVTAVAQVLSLAQELPHASGETNKKKKKERKKKEVTRRVTGDLGSVLQEEHILLILKMSV